MKLWYAPTSPFARKVRIVAHELGLADRIEAIEVNPWTDARLRALVLQGLADGANGLGPAVRR